MIAKRFFSDTTFQMGVIGSFAQCCGWEALEFGGYCN